VKPLDKKIVVVTGGAGGIGGLVCDKLRSAGASVIGVDRLPCPMADETIIADLGNFDGLAKLSAELEALKPDVLLNLAGVQYFGPFSAQSKESLWSGYVINLIAPAMLSRAVLPAMRQRGHGRIVNIGSVFGAIPFAHFVSYSSAKAGLKGLSQALRRELRDTGVEVTHIAPRAVCTPLNSDQVLAFAEITKMNMDSPELVASRIVTAIIREQRDVVIGFPESLFVRINALAPAIIDRALAANDRKAAKMFN